MGTTARTEIMVEATIQASIQKVWACWTEPKHITKWCQASDDWHAPAAENDLRKDGRFKTTMAAKDGSMSFDFEGIYANVIQNQLMEYTIADGRKVKITFEAKGTETKVIEIFEAEDQNSEELQRGGWQAILDNFKKYVEAN